jgi:FkbM family methyltransferase
MKKLDFGLGLTNRFQKKSYSQCGEDLIVKHIFDALNINKFKYLDVGAHHPYYLSNTALFYELGMTGINIEPDPELFDRFKKYRKKDVNLNVGISNYPGEQDFFIISSSTLNTFSEQEVNNYLQQGDYTVKKKIKVITDNITNIINKYNNGVYPEFMTIDAEGVDELLIEMIDFSNKPPIVICIETISFSTSGNGIKNRPLIEKIESLGYLNYADTNINSIFVLRSFWER